MSLVRKFVRATEKDGKKVAGGLFAMFLFVAIYPKGRMNYRRAKKRDKRMKELEPMERNAVAFIEKKLKEEKWMDHFEAMQRVPTTEK